MNLLHTASGSNVPRLKEFAADVAKFNVGTRKSKLALKQTDLVVSALTATFPDNEYDVKARDTAAGDIDKVTPFKDMPVKNLWTHELETLMLENQLDILVHSLKGESRRASGRSWCLTALKTFPRSYQKAASLVLFSNEKTLAMPSFSKLVGHHARFRICLPEPS